MRVPKRKHSIGRRAYLPKVKHALLHKETLYANRRGLSLTYMDEEKPSYTPEELVANRRRGLSLESIGKKTWDCAQRKDVVTVLRKYDPSLPTIEKIQKPIVKCYPSPLWYLFDSELEVVVKESVPQSSHLLSAYS